MPASSVNLNRLAAFVAVVETGSFTAAAERLGLTKAMASQHVSRLESELGVALFTRTTRRVVPTEAGSAFYADCARVLQDMDSAISRLAGNPASPSGLLRVTSSDDYGAAVVVPALAAFQEKFPEVRVDFSGTDKVIDLVAGGYDLSIRTGWVREQNLRSVQLGSFEQMLVASPAYVHRHGVPRQPKDVAAHRWIAFTLLRSPYTWTFAPKRGTPKTVRVSAAISTNGSASLRAFLREGTGISVLPGHMAVPDIQAGRLVHLLPEWRLPSGGIFAVYPNVRFTPVKVRAFIDFFRERLDPHSLDRPGK
ncbi:MAG: LysR family transcriptional regulator [Burkholderiales bacterium]